MAGSVIARPGERGMSLVEVLVALLLFTVSLLGLAAAFPFASHAVAVAGQQTVLALLAQQAIEIARQSPYDTLPTLDTGGFVEVPGHAGFRRSVSVVPRTPTAGTTAVTVVVRFGPDGTVGDMTLSTVISR